MPVSAAAATASPQATSRAVRSVVRRRSRATRRRPAFRQSKWVLVFFKRAQRRGDEKSAEPGAMLQRFDPLPGLPKDYPRDTSKSYIKRVIGVAGDRIRIENGQVYVNGEALDEDYVPTDYADARSYGEVVVPANSFFVLGDHRTMSNDSRDFGAVNERYIYGKAVFGYWPMEKMGRLR